MVTVGFGETWRVKIGGRVAGSWCSGYRCHLVREISRFFFGPINLFYVVILYSLVFYHIM